MSTADACVFGGAPNAVDAPEKIFDAVESCACVSMPMTISQLMRAPHRDPLPPGEREKSAAPHPDPLPPGEREPSAARRVRGLANATPSPADTDARHSG